MRQQIGGQHSDVLDYLQSMLGQLRHMADEEGCDMIAYLIEMAYLETNDTIRGERSSRVRKDEGHRAT